MKVAFVFHLEIKVRESEGRVERHRIKVLWSQVLSCLTFPQVRDDLIWAAMLSAGVGPLCATDRDVCYVFCPESTQPFNLEISEHFMLVEMLIFFSSRLGNCIQCQKSRLCATDVLTPLNIVKLFYDANPPQTLSFLLAHTGKRCLLYIGT